MTLNKSQVNGNTAAGSSAVASGGGIVNVNIGVITNAPIRGVLTINNSEVNNNTAGGDGGGIANGFTVDEMSLPRGSITMSHSQVMGGQHGCQGRWHLQQRWNGCPGDDHRQRQPLR